MSQTQVESLLVQAQQAKQSGDKNQARSLLSQVLKAEPHNEEAWLLLAEVAEKKEHSIYCLEQVLKLNPANMQTVERLNALRSPAPTITTPSIATHVAAPVTKASSEPETVIHKEHIHWAMFINPVILLVLGVLTMLPGFLERDLSTFICVGAPFVALALLAMLRLVIVYFTHEFVLTNKRIVIKTGLLSRNTFEVLLTKVEGIGVSQPLFGRIFGYGSIVITGTGGAKQIFRGMKKPVEFRELIEAQIARLQKSA